MINLKWMYSLTLYSLNNIEPNYNTKIYGNTMRNESIPQLVIMTYLNNSSLKTDKI